MEMTCQKKSDGDGGRCFTERTATHMHSCRPPPLSSTTLACLDREGIGPHLTSHHLSLRLTSACVRARAAMQQRQQQQQHQWQLAWLQEFVAPKRGKTNPPRAGHAVRTTR